MSIADELQKLDALRVSGALSGEEYARAKALILDGAPAPAAPTTGPGQPNLLRRFTRSSRDKWLGGVCGGLGEHTPAPAWAWRVGFCLLLLTFGIGLVPYLLLWIFVPADDGVS